MGKKQTEFLVKKMGPEPVINNWKPMTSHDRTKKTHQLNELYTWAHNIVMWHLSADTYFDSCQLTLAWKSNINLNTDCTCHGLNA